MKTRSLVKLLVAISLFEAVISKPQLNSWGNIKEEIGELLKERFSPIEEKVSRIENKLEGIDSSHYVVLLTLLYFVSDTFILSQFLLFFYSRT